jgi:hypothetical protein
MAGMRKSLLNWSKQERLIEHFWSAYNGTDGGSSDPLKNMQKVSVF